MIKFIKKFFHEIWLQLTLSPTFASKHKASFEKPHVHLEAISSQIAKVVESTSHSLIFLIAPTSVKKSDYVQYFVEQHPKFHYVYKSFMRLRDVDFAFLHLINYWARVTFIGFFFFLAYFLAQRFPLTQSLPLLLAVGYFFKTHPSNLLYILHESLDNILTRKHRVVIVDDLSKSAIDNKDQWSLLINLWDNKRTYLVPMSYSLQDKNDKLNLLEKVNQLGGIIIEIPLNEQSELERIKQLDPDFPFALVEKEPSSANWLKMLSAEDFEKICQLVQSTSEKRPSLSASDKQTFYISKCLKLLSNKMELDDGSVEWDSQKKALHGIVLEKLPPNKKECFDSFLRSLNTLSPSN